MVVSPTTARAAARPGVVHDLIVSQRLAMGIVRRPSDTHSCSTRERLDRRLPAASDRFDNARADFAATYTEQNQRDYETAQSQLKAGPL
jgi:hypothetical protein